MEALCVALGVLHGWHFLAWHSESLPWGQKYELGGRILVALWTLGVGILPALVDDPRIPPRASACWLLAQVVDTVGFHDLAAPGWFPLAVGLATAVTVAVPWVRFGVALVCALWLGVVWPWALAPRPRGYGVAFVWQLGVMAGTMGVVGDLAPGSQWWAWCGPLSATFYTFLCIGRFVPGILDGRESYRLHDREPATVAGVRIPPARVVDSDSTAPGSGSGGSSWSDIPRVVQYDPDDWRSSLSTGWSSRDQDGAGGVAGVHPGQGGQGVREQDIGESLLFLGV